MKLEIGDVVEFKKYEDMNDDEIFHIDRDFFPKSGKITEIKNDGFFTIEDYGYVFNPESVARVIRDENRFNQGDEILVKATVKKDFGTFLQIEPSVDNSDIVKVLKRKEPEHFIVQEDHYGMYIGTARELVQDKSVAKIYTSRKTANYDAADMHLNAWDVIPYDD